MLLFVVDDQEVWYDNFLAGVQGCDMHIKYILVLFLSLLHRCTLQLLNTLQSTVELSRHENLRAEHIYLS